jgi:NADH dehydrogenase
MTQPSGYTPPSFEPVGSSAIAVEEQPDQLRHLRAKPIVVTGASGLVGTHVSEELVRRGFKVRGVVRNMTRAAQRLGHLSMEIRTGDVRDVGDMRSALSGAGAVIHLAAIAIEKPGQGYTDVNSDGTRVLVDSAAAESVRRFVFMSQNGADSRSKYPFLRSKGIAQDIVQGSSLQWTILRPSVIFGPEDEFVSVLARLVRLSPFVFPLPGGGTARFQPVAVADVARAVAKVIADDATIHRTYAIGGAAPLTLRQMTERILIAMNVRRALVGVPVSLLRPLVAAAQKLLPRPPVTTGLLDLLETDNVVERNDLPGDLGIPPVPFAPEELLYLRKITAGDAMTSLFRG